jgi:hypothetical protein
MDQFPEEFMKKCLKEQKPNINMKERDMHIQHKCFKQIEWKKRGNRWEARYVVGPEEVGKTFDM